MFRLLVDALVSPKAIALHVDEKPKRRFVGFIIILVVLLMIPTVLAMSKTIEFSNTETEGIIASFKNNKEIDYQIKDGTLKYTGVSNAPRQYLKIEDTEFLLTELPIYLVFSLDGSGYDINDKTGYVVLFKEKELEIIFVPSQNNNGAEKLAGVTDIFQKTPKEEVVKTISYDDLDVDFNYKNSSTNSYFLQIYSVGNHIYSKLKLRIILENSLISLVSNLIIFTASTFFTILLIKLFFRGIGVKFGKIVKIAFLASLPYVLCYVLAYLYDLYLLAYIGELISLFYTFRALSCYALMQKVNINGGNNNEL